MKFKVEDIPDINKFQGTIPTGADLVIYPKGNYTDDNAIVLYGFDEIGLFDNEIKGAVQYAFVSVVK